MITLEMCLDYIQHHRREPYIFAETMYDSIELTKVQKKFLKNLCEGKITDTPRVFGKTFIIKLYCECLDYYTDMVKYNPSIKKDDYISLTEAAEGFCEVFSTSYYSRQAIIDAYNTNPEIAMREYNFAEKDLEGWIYGQN